MARVECRPHGWVDGTPASAGLDSTAFFSPPRCLEDALLVLDARGGGLLRQNRRGFGKRSSTQLDQRAALCQGLKKCSLKFSPDCFRWSRTSMRRCAIHWKN